MAAAPRVGNTNSIPTTWYRLHVYNNIIADNMAGLAGGGISLQDVAQADIVHNTLYGNDSSGTSGSAFPAGNPNQSNPLPAGVVSHAHTAALRTAFNGATSPNRTAYGIFSNPVPFANNIVRGSRSYFAQIAASQNIPGPFNLVLATLPIASWPANYSFDLAVLGTTTGDCAGGCFLHPSNSALTTSSAPYNQTATYHNIFTNPNLLTTYLNGSRSALAPFGSTIDIQMAPAFDEGGNFIDVRFGPLTLYNPTTVPPSLFGNYHIGTGPAVGAGQTLNNLYGSLLVPAALRTDFDGNNRSASSTPDIGADQR